MTRGTLWILDIAHPRICKTMAPPKEKKVKKGTPPPIDKLLLPAIGVTLALVAYQFLKRLGANVRYRGRVEQSLATLTLTNVMWSILRRTVASTLLDTASQPGR
jgi:hypothetical protein